MSVALDWKLVGRILQLEALDMRKRLPSQQLNALDRQVAEHAPLRAHLEAMLDVAEDGEATVAALLSKAPRTDQDREALSRAIEDGLALRKELAYAASKRGKKPVELLHIATTEANAIFNDWKDTCDRSGIDRYGHRGEMIEEAVRFVFEEWHPEVLSPVDSEKTRLDVQGRLDRTKSRRPNST